MHSDTNIEGEGCRQCDRLENEVEDLRAALRNCRTVAGGKFAEQHDEITALKSKLHHYQYRLRRVIGWRENDWPEWFDRRTAEAVAELATPDHIPEPTK